MQYEQKCDSNETGGAAIEYTAGDRFDSAGKTAKSAYPYARMMNLIEQCRSIESKFRKHKYTIDLGQDYAGSLKEIQALHQDVIKVSERLHRERFSFTEHVSGRRVKGKDGADTKVDYLCTKGKCHYTINGSELMSRKKQHIKTSRYTSQVLDTYIQHLKIIDKRLMSFLERIYRENEAVKARSASQAKEFSRVEDFDSRIEDLEL